MEIKINFISSIKSSVKYQIFIRILSYFSNLGQMVKFQIQVKIVIKFVGNWYENLREFNIETSFQAPFGAFSQSFLTIFLMKFFDSFLRASRLFF